MGRPFFPIISGPGEGRHPWDIQEDGPTLRAHHVPSGQDFLFDTNNNEDCLVKLSHAKLSLPYVDYMDLENYVLRSNNFVRGGRGKIPSLADHPSDLRNELGHKRGCMSSCIRSCKADPSVCEAKKVVFKDGKRTVVETRPKTGSSTPAQQAAAFNASKYAHTPEAEKKRRKSIDARREAKITGEVNP